ncbi:MAG: hypothetical protein Q9213_007339 [Squamulea squamosa]
MASQAGGPNAPLEPDRRDIGYTDYGLAMNFNDITVHNPEVAGGRLRFDEVKAVYEGVAAVINQIGYEECAIQAWRMQELQRDWDWTMQQVIDRQQVDMGKAFQDALNLFSYNEAGIFVEQVRAL